MTWLRRYRVGSFFRSSVWFPPPVVQLASAQLKLPLVARVRRIPDWEDFVGLAITEIRQFGRDSIQIARRMRAMLESLIEVVPPRRASPLRTELELLSRGVEREFRDPEDRDLAASGDSLGVGGKR